MKQSACVSHTSRVSWRSNNTLFKWLPSIVFTKIIETWETSEISEVFQRASIQYVFFFILKSHDQCYQNKELRLWFEDITILYFVGTWNPQKVRIQNSTYRELQFQLDPSSFETWHGMYTIALESEDEVGIPGIFKVKKTDNFSGSLDSWAGWPYPYWQVLENSSYAARAKELQGMMLKTKGAEAPFHQWNLGKIHGISWKSMGMFGFLGSWRFEVFQISSWKYQFSGLANDSKSQNEGRIKKYIDSCFHLF